MKNKIIITLSLFLFTTMSAQTGWFMIGTLSTSNHNEYGDIYAFDANHICVMADNGHFYATTDGGVNWNHTDLSVVAKIYDLTFNNNLGVAVGENGTVLLTHDSGNTWQSVQIGINENLYETAIPDSSNIWVAGANGVLLHSNNAGATWQINNTITNNDLYSIQFRDSQTGYFAGANQTIYKTTDAGTTWQVIPFDYNGNDLPIKNISSLSLTTNKLTMLVGNDIFDQKAFTTSDEINWNTIDSIYFLPLADVFAVNDSVIFLSSILIPVCDCPWEDRIQKSAYNQLTESFTFSTDYPMPAGSTYTNSLFFIDDTTGFFLAGDYVFKTTDAGNGYTQIDDPTLGISKYDQDIVSIFPNPSNDYLNIHIKHIKNKANIYLQVINDNGQSFYKQKIIEDNTGISLKAFSKGIYIVNIVQNNHIIFSKKIIKK